MYARILVPLDGSDTAARGLQEAAALARELHARLHLLHVIDEFSLRVDVVAMVNLDELRQSMRLQGEAMLAKARQLAADQGVTADTHLIETSRGRVSEVILDQAKALGCGLIVMGTHGRRGFSRTVIGSDAEQVLRGSSLPVLLVRQPEGIP